MATVLQDTGLGLGVSEFEATNPAWRPLLQARTWVAIVIWLVGTDLAIYRGRGWTGWAVVFALVPVIMAIGPRRQRAQLLGWSIVCALIVLLSMKLVWCGTMEAVLAASFLAFAAMLAGQGVVPYVGQLLIVPFRMTIGVCSTFIESTNVARNDLSSVPAKANDSRISGQTSVGIALPVLAVTLFGGIFILANPNFRIWFDDQWQSLRSTITSWLAYLDALEFVFWACSGTLGLATMFPYVADLLQQPAPTESIEDPQEASRAAYFYPAARNTLSALVVLFAAYLGYEFYSMWFREFPTGFYYSGYAHEGAFWLTVALAQSVFTLSTIFCKTMLRDSRTDRLKWLAWLWSVENFLLAAAVYNRLLIYIDFNGMTRMRVIGLVGVSAVAIGFCLVVFKIAKQCSFEWLIQRQLWALSLSLIVYALLPVDWLVHRINASQVLSGDLAPAVQMIAHSTRADGMLQILRLMDCQDTEIREGVRALAAKWSNDLENRLQPTSQESRDQRIAVLSPHSQCSRNWSHYQLSEVMLQQILATEKSKYAEYADENAREQQLKRFYDYAYQWY